MPAVAAASAGGARAPRLTALPRPHLFAPTGDPLTPARRVAVGAPSRPAVIARPAVIEPKLKTEPVRFTPPQQQPTLPHLADLTSIVPENPAARIPGVVITESARRRRQRLAKSRAQHRWMFATHQPFAHQWAVRGRYKTLPERTGLPTARTVR